MDTNSPTALIVGIENFGAKELAIELINRGINVIGVGDYVSGMKEHDDFENRIYLKDAVEEVRYVFDFEGDKQAWEKAKNDGAKLILVDINDKKVCFDEDNFGDMDWRKVKLHGLFGQGMDKNTDETTRVLVNGAEAAVKNKNLSLPAKQTELRLLATQDGVETIIRVAMLPGLNGEEVEIWGREITSAEMAGKLIELAKMTRFKVAEEEVELKEIPKGKVETGWNKIRWEPAGEWKRDFDLMLQYFFTKADEESRKPKQETNNPEPVTRIEPKRVLTEVVVEPEENGETSNQKPVTRIEPEVEQVKEEEISNPEPATRIEPKEEWDIEKIVIKNSNSRPRVAEPEEGFSFEKEIKKIEENKPLEIKKIEKKPKESKLSKFGFKKISFGVLKWMMVWMGGLVVIWGLVAVGRGVVIYQGLKQSVKLVEAKDYDKAAKIVDSQYKLMVAWDEEISSWGLNKWAIGRNWQEVLRLGENAATVESDTILVAKSGEVINDGIWGDGDVDWGKELPIFTNSLRNLSNDMGMLEARMDGDWSWMPGRWRDQMNSYKKTVTNKRNVVANGVRLAGVMEELLGTDGKRKDYLVLFQNENEIRPSGGFIGSYGVMTFDDGKFINLDVQDVYEADGQLKGHVEPPVPIKKYLGEGGWYMRDANWEADFRDASKVIQWFFEKETGRKVDGVVAVNLSVAKAILGVTGEVFVPDFKEKVNKNNLYEQAEFYAETQFFPGSIQKASFLGMLSKQLFEQIKSMDMMKKAELAEALVNMADEREIQVNLADQTAMSAISDLAWDGAIMGGRCGGKECFSDYLQVNEANFGVNKANYFLYRNMEQTVELTPNLITRVVRVTYENTSKNSNWPGGDYKAYVRVYIPETSNLAEVSVTDPRGGKTVYQTNDIQISSYSGKKEVGLLLQVPFSSKRVLELRYTDTVNLAQVANFSYLQYVQKQSGFGDTGMAVLVTVPNGWQVNQVEPAASVVGGKLLFNQKLNKDLKIGVEIGK